MIPEASKRIGFPQKLSVGSMEINLSEGVPKALELLIYRKSFLMPLTEIVCPPIRLDGVDFGLQRRLETKKILLMHNIPEAWFYSYLGLNFYTSQRLQAIIDNPVNIDHGEPHITRYRNNFFALSPYLADIVSLREKDLQDFMIAGGLSCLHDHVEIDGGNRSIPNIKAVHAHLGAVNAVGVIRAMRAQGAPISERVEKLVFFAIYHHSYPLRFSQSSNISIEKILELYPEAMTDFSVLAETQQLLKSLGISLLDIDVQLDDLTKQRLAQPLLRDVFSADKRDSMVPPFLAILRTMFTDPKRPFSKNDINYHLTKLANFLDSDYKPKEKDFETDLDRIVYEFVRNYYDEGMSGFAVEWLGASMTKKLEYVVKFTKALIDGDFRFISEKFMAYSESLWSEYYMETAEASAENFKIKGDRMFKKLKGLELQYEETIELMKQKTSLPVLNEDDLNLLIEKIINADRLPLVGQHLPFPDKLLPVFTVDDLPI